MRADAANALAPGERMLLGSTRPSGPTQKKERLHVRARHLRPGPRGQGRDRERLEDLVPERAPDHERAGRLQGRPIAGGSETGKGLSVTLWEGDEELLKSTEAEYHKQAIERFGEFFPEGVHDPENYQVNLYMGDIYESKEGGPGLEIFRETQAEAS